MLSSAFCHVQRCASWRAAGRPLVKGQNVLIRVIATTTVPTGLRAAPRGRHGPAARCSPLIVAVAAPAPRGVGAPPGDIAPHRPATAATSAPAAADVTPRQAGSLFGAIALITGSTVGAGMLALPAVSAPAGIIPTGLSLTTIWGLLTLDALLIAEVNLAARDARDASRAETACSSAADGAAAAAAGSNGGGGGGEGNQGGIVTLRQMAEFSLGKAGKSFTVIYLMLAYSLLTAYCTKAAEVLDYFAGGGLSPLAAATVFVGAIGGLLYGGGSRATDALCQGLTSVLLLLFGVILTAGAAQSCLPTSLLSEPVDWGALGPAVPIMFLSLVYHDLIPVIVDYLGGDRKSIRSAIVLGSLVPLAMFVSWEAVALSLLPTGLVDGAAASGSAAVLQASLHLSADGAPAVGAAAAAAVADAPGVALAVDPLEVFVHRSSPLIGSVVEGFSFLAVMTSFIGTTLSLSETLRTEVPPLLREACKQLRRTSGAEVSTDLSEDELACLADGNNCAPGVAGCSATAACQDGEGAGTASDSEDWALFPGEQRGLALLLTLCPPLVMAVANPDSFLGALQLAGGYFMTLLYGILPPLMAWKLREKLHSRQDSVTVTGSDNDPLRVTMPALGVDTAVECLQQRWREGTDEQPYALSQAQAQKQPWWRQQHEEMVPGGTIVLGSLFSAAMGIELSRLAADASHLSSSGGGGDAGFVQSLIEAALLSPSTPEAVVAFVSQAMAALDTLQW